MTGRSTRAALIGAAALFACARVAGAQALFIPAVQYGDPLRISGGLAVFVPVGETGTFFRQGVVVEGGAGQGGARISGGVARFLEDFGLDARAVLSRTWSSPRHASPDSTYGGLEAGLSFAYVRVSAGVAHRISGPPEPDDATILTWGVALQLPHYFHRK